MPPTGSNKVADERMAGVQQEDPNVSNLGSFTDGKNINIDAKQLGMPGAKVNDIDFGDVK